MLKIQQLDYGTVDYQETVVLRSLVLREPLGLAFDTAELLGEKESFHFGLYQEGRLLGCFVMKAVDEKTIKIRQVAVRPEHQGQGYGHTMMQFAEQFASRRNYSIITLHARDTVTDFYKSLGYSLIGQPFMEVTLRHWRMEKLLD